MKSDKPTASLYRLFDQISLLNQRIEVHRQHRRVDYLQVWLTRARNGHPYYSRRLGRCHGYVLVINIECLHDWLVSLPRPLEQLNPFANIVALALKDKEEDFLYSREQLD